MSLRNEDVEINGKEANEVISKHLIPLLVCNEELVIEFRELRRNMDSFYHLAQHPQIAADHYSHFQRIFVLRRSEAVDFIGCHVFAFKLL